jgi:hypothetical protein
MVRRSKPEVSQKSFRSKAGSDSCDNLDFLRAVRQLNETPHGAKNDNSRTGSSWDHKTTRQPGHAISPSRRWLAERRFRDWRGVTAIPLCAKLPAWL